LSTVAPNSSKTLTIEQTAVELGIGRNLAYELARRGELPGVRRLGKRFIVSRAALERYLADGAPQQ
jgi:excisionase family DNA binding protein